MKTIISICDFTGNWSRPYVEREYFVIRLDVKFPKKLTQMSDGGFSLGFSIEEAAEIKIATLIENVHGILAAPPCTDFAASGSKFWKEKDFNGDTQKSIRLVKACLKLIALAKPAFWALENPVGRLPTLVPELGKAKLTFHPYWYADWIRNGVWEAYTKKTLLYGHFNPNLKRKAIEPITLGGKAGGYLHLKYGGKSERTKTARSTTPLGFAYAFAEANP